MSTNLYVVLGHNLSAAQMAELPTLLNQYFAPHIHQIQVRVDHGYTGTLIEAEDGGWGWQASESDDRELQIGKLENEDLWNWAWYSEQGESFQDWFQRRQSYGYVPLIGCYEMSLLVGSSLLVLCTDIRWHHFVLDPIVQNDLRQFIHYFAAFLGTTSAIYMPDDVPPACNVIDEHMAQGRSFEQITHWLQSQEPPAKSMRETLKTVYVKSMKCWSAQGYYIEEFL